MCATSFDPATVAAQEDSSRHRCPTDAGNACISGNRRNPCDPFNSRLGQQSILTGRRVGLRPASPRSLRLRVGPEQEQEKEQEQEQEPEPEQEPEQEQEQDICPTLLPKVSLLGLGTTPIPAAANLTGAGSPPTTTPGTSVAMRTTRPQPPRRHRGRPRREGQGAGDPRSAPRALRRQHGVCAERMLRFDRTSVAVIQIATLR